MEVHPRLSNIAIRGRNDSRASEPATEARSPARILLVDQHPLFRRGVRDLFHDQPEFALCAEVGTVAEARAHCESDPPDAMIVSISLPDGNGLDLVRHLNALRPGLPILVLSAYDEKFYAEHALRAGARGYVMKSEPPATVLEALCAVLRGDLFVSPRISGGLLKSFLGANRGPGMPSQVRRLSCREAQVFECIADGMIASEIARHLHISTKTVDTHRASIRFKLGLKSAHDLVRAAICWQAQSPAARPPPPQRPQGSS